VALNTIDITFFITESENIVLGLMFSGVAMYQT